MQPSYHHVLAWTSVFLGACVYFSFIGFSFPGQPPLVSRSHRLTHRYLTLTRHVTSKKKPAMHGALARTGVSPGKAVKPGTKLRILCVGDSITSGYFSNGTNLVGNGYRLQVREDLSEDEVVFAGTEVAGYMTDGYYAAWGGMPIEVISERLGPSLKHRPNIVLLHAGTNDLSVRVADHSAVGSVERLGRLIDQITTACPDAVVLVAVVIPRCNPFTAPEFAAFQALIPETVKDRRAAGRHVLAVDMSSFPESHLQDCAHPTAEGYLELGHYWYDYITQIPTSWINDPVGPDPVRNETRSGR